MSEFYGFKTDKIKYQKKSSKIWQITKFGYNIFVIMNKWFKKFMNDTDEIFHKLCNW